MVDPARTQGRLELPIAVEIVRLGADQAYPSGAVIVAALALVHIRDGIADRARFPVKVNPADIDPHPSPGHSLVSGYHLQAIALRLQSQKLGPLDQ